MIATFFSCFKKNKIKNQEAYVKNVPEKDKVWVFIMAGQSNMAGRGLIEPIDTITTNRIITINKQNRLILAKEPIHFYEHPKNGLDCGMSFGKTLLDSIPDQITILLLPTAVGATSIQQWLNDDLHENVRLLSNFKEKVKIAKKYGELKGLLWHQGESDANRENISGYKNNFKRLIKTFRTVTNDPSLPIFAGELGSFSKNPEYWEKINKNIHEIASMDEFLFVVETGDLKDKGDKMHFDSRSIRTLGRRYAYKYLKFKKRELNF